MCQFMKWYYRIAGNFRGIQFSRFSRLSGEPRKLNPRNKRRSRDTCEREINRGRGHFNHRSERDRLQRWSTNSTAVERPVILRSFLFHVVLLPTKMPSSSIESATKRRSEAKRCRSRRLWELRSFPDYNFRSTMRSYAKKLVYRL